MRLQPLGPDDTARALAQAGVDAGEDAPRLSELAAGSVGEAIRLARYDGLRLYAEIIALLGTLPRLDRVRGLALAEAVAKRGAEEQLDLLYVLFETAFARLARQGASGQARPEAAPGEAQILAHLAPDAVRARAWAETAQHALERARHGRAVNLDAAALVLDTLTKLQETATA